MKRHDPLPREGAALPAATPNNMGFSLMQRGGREASPERTRSLTGGFAADQAINRQALFLGRRLLEHKEGRTAETASARGRASEMTHVPRGCRFTIRLPIAAAAARGTEWLGCGDL